MSLSLIYQGEMLKPRIAAVLGEFGLTFHGAERSPYPIGLNEKLHVVYAMPEDQRRRGVAIEIGLDSMDATMDRLRTEIGKLHPDRVPKPKPAEAPRVTLTEIEAEIASEHCFTALDGRRGAIDSGSYVGRENPTPNDADLVPLGLVTFCVLVLRNGCKVVGINHGPVDPANFDAEHGRRDAREDAIRQVWPLLGFRLRDQLSATKLGN